MDMRKVLARALIESDIAVHFATQVKGAEGWAIRFWPITLAGFPDWIVLWETGAINFVELKKPGGKPRPLQRLLHARLARYGHVVFVLSTFEQVDQYVKSHRPS